MKVAPLMRAFAARPEFEARLIHTGQHYDEAMSDLMFRQLQIPEPAVNLGVGGGSHAENTGEIMKRFEKVCLEWPPFAVMVVGDVDSTIACGLVAVKLGIKLFHVEAGLRSFDRAMPEEINRLLTDAISDLLLCTEQSGVENLRREGVAEEKIHLVGNVMIDTLLANIEKAKASDILERLSLEPGGYGVLTLHRPSNVDQDDVFGRIVSALEVIQRDAPIVFPVHPRTASRMSGSKAWNRMKALPNIRLTEPLGYLEFLKLMSMARVVLTDSGGIQEETTILGVPCLTLRDNTERPVTTRYGSNILVGNQVDRILAGYRELMSKPPRRQVPPLWDGRAADRIVELIAEIYLRNGEPEPAGFSAETH
jgi:UDP-N-acetylglucosamine 2-epimerase (non-hydrolysing)